MKSSHIISALFCAALAFGSTGCMRGMTYKIAMPESMTLGTVKHDEASLASAQSLRSPRTVANATR